MNKSILTSAHSGTERRAVVAYSDVTIQATIKKRAPVPINKVQRAIATKAIVIPTDGFCTSVFCCKCLRRTQLRYSNNPRVCRHKKRKTRIPTVVLREDDSLSNTRSIKVCLDDDSHVLHRAIGCPDLESPRRAYPIYPLKLCLQCPENDGANIIWNRDTRGAFTRYIVSNFNQASRPEELSRRHRGQQNPEG